MISRFRLLNNIPFASTGQTVIYWMSRDQRCSDNWALLFAAELAKKYNKRLRVVFSLNKSFLGATLRQYDFMLDGLTNVKKKLEGLNIPFDITMPKTGVGSNSKLDIPNLISDYINSYKAFALVTDFDPLRIKREWKRKLIDLIDIPIYEVDAHNIIPTWVSSDKEEYGAYTLRPKIKKLLSEYLTDFPLLLPFSVNNMINCTKIDKLSIIKQLEIDRDIKPIDWIKGGEENGWKVLDEFINSKIANYSSLRNDPTKDYQSDLSPFLHFGQISAQRIALEVKTKVADGNVTESFLEELIVRRELADNYCYYNQNYDNFDGFKDWAKLTLNNHKLDKREYIYTKEEFENSKTHDLLWNAAQMQMVSDGKMHGYMRMYWAKKILEWTDSPEEAISTAICLNDKYEIDGRDPNGYTGIAWSIGGIHDRAWFEREVFGKIRYMNYNGASKKFDVKMYIQRYLV